MTSGEKALAWGLGIVTAVLVGVGIWEETKKPAASGGGGGGGGGVGNCPAGQTLATNLVPGHRYNFTASCPPAYPLPLPPLGATDAVATFIFGTLSGITIFNYSPDTANNRFGVIFDYAGATQQPLPTIQSGGSTACTSQLCDMGLTAAQQQGGVQNQKLTLPTNAAGPYTLQTPTAGSYTLLNGKVYLIEAPPIPGQTLAQTVDSLLALYPNLKPASGTAEANSWDVGQVPIGWPDSDATVRRVAVIVSMSITFPAPATTKVWLATGAAQATPPATQSLAATVAGPNKASAIQGGKLVVTAPWPISTVSGPPVKSQSATAAGVATIVLSGQPGTIAVYGPQSLLPPYTMPSLSIDVA